MPDELFFSFNRLSEEDGKFIQDTIDQVGYTFYLTNALKRRFDKRVILVGKFGQGLFAFNAEYKKCVAKWIKLNVMHNHYTLGDCFGDVSITPSEVFLGLKEGASIFPYKEHEQTFPDTQMLFPPDSKKSPETESSQNQSESKRKIREEKSGIYLITQKLSKKKRSQNILSGVTGTPSSQQSLTNTEKLNGNSGNTSSINLLNPRETNMEDEEGRRREEEGDSSIVDRSRGNNLLNEPPTLPSIHDNNGKLTVSQLGIIGSIDKNNDDNSSISNIDRSRNGDNNVNTNVDTENGECGVDGGYISNSRVFPSPSSDGPLSFFGSGYRKTYKKRFFVTPIMRTEIAPIIRTDICMDRENIIYFFKKSELYSVDIQRRQVSLLFNLKSIKSLFIKEMQGKEFIIIICKMKVYYGAIDNFALKKNPMLKEKPVKIPLTVVNGEVYTTSDGTSEKIDIETLLLTDNPDFIIEPGITKIETQTKIFRKNYFVEPISFPRGSPYIFDKSSNCYLAIDKNGVIMSISTIGAK